MSKNFAWLRIVTYLNLVLLVGYFVYLIYQVVTYLPSGTGNTLAYGLNILMVMVPLIHTIFVINIQLKFYPNRLLDPTLKTWTDVFNVLGWIVMAIYCLGIIGVLIRLSSYNSAILDDDWIITVVLFGLFMIVVLTVLQLAGSRRLIRTIQRNYRLEFENSFL